MINFFTLWETGNIRIGSSQLYILQLIAKNLALTAITRIFLHVACPSGVPSHKNAFFSMNTAPFDVIQVCKKSTRKAGSEYVKISVKLPVVVSGKKEEAAQNRFFSCSPQLAKIITHQIHIIKI